MTDSTRFSTMFVSIIAVFCTLVPFYAAAQESGDLPRTIKDSLSGSDTYYGTDTVDNALIEALTQDAAEAGITAEDITLNEQDTVFVSEISGASTNTASDTLYTIFGIAVATVIFFAALFALRRRNLHQESGVLGGEVNNRNAPIA